MVTSNYTAKQPDSRGFIEYTAEENETWAILYERQWQIVQNRACQAYLDGMEALNMPVDRVPQCTDINQALAQHTGWAVEPVAAIIPLTTFYALLANKKFPAATFVRTREDLDYLKEPDLFHEYFGHCPLLTNQAYADYMQWYGKLALTADKKAQTLLGRLFWFTIEFGLIQHNHQFTCYGGGILSSKEETVYAVESDIPKRIPLDIAKALRTPYRYDMIQPLYYCLESLDDLYHIMDADLLKLADEAKENGDLEPSFITC